MKRVTGIGGVFIKAKDPKGLTEWYKKHLGIDVLEWGGATFMWSDPDATRPDGGVTVWSLFPADSEYFGNPAQQVMVNYRVANLDQLVEALRAEGCDVDSRTETSEYGRFGWVTDPEGNRIELWEPPVRS